MFPHTGSDEPWWETIDAAPADVVTYIVQREDTEGQLVPVKFHDGRSLNLCLLVKRDNRKKHNSHEWFFSCAKVFGAKYALTTDCGTLYDSECTYRLLRHMEENEGVQTCTGRQRVMSMGMQEVEKGDSLMEMWYRSIQAFDYEVSITSFQAAFALVGFLPVIPGPLGMWRMEGLDDALEHYYTIASAKQTGELIQGNLLLAEDRILSYGAVFFTKKRADWV
ncbi:hypothetical protein SARC_16095 [Sphaeroforma arctica JP610]|uniref:chitin synthase n=1 Tax=Sphaeroforma arctica JP610 TaxID=667725 RepID=A0A0L0F424_9EUKA|nr:hypothetical protein SARC_16095 [Sphaeroforma arctica JP610]KNC71366.1 hypothetical protein SARC_16095 [Sphaeroforma arctica JP610]|eukprot:XP_014145268.1 hypothetical protein SARC_16095 [Sphaeroforma arctica JP610]